jgi:ribosomal subunit interface protein
MTLRISGKGLDVGEAFRGHIERRINSTLAKYQAGPAAGHVTVEREGAGFRADCTLHLKSGATVQADCRAHEPYASFNRAAALIENQVKRHRKRLVAHHPGMMLDRKFKLEEPRKKIAGTAGGGRLITGERAASLNAAEPYSDPNNVSLL